jgi:hypothetical protein
MEAPVLVEVPARPERAQAQAFVVWLMTGRSSRRPTPGYSVVFWLTPESRMRSLIMPVVSFVSVSCTGRSEVEAKTPTSITTVVSPAPAPPVTVTVKLPEVKACVDVDVDVGLLTSVDVDVGLLTSVDVDVGLLTSVDVVVDVGAALAVAGAACSAPSPPWRVRGSVPSPAGRERELATALTGGERVGATGAAFAVAGAACSAPSPAWRFTGVVMPMRIVRWSVPFPAGRERELATALTAGERVGAAAAGAAGTGTADGSA